MSIDTPIITYQGHGDNVFAVAWSPDGTWIASGSRDTTVRVWKASAGEDYLVYQDHASYLLSLAWSPDGKRLASGDTAGTVRIWEAFTGRTITTYHRHTRFVRSVALSPDGTHIATGGDYGDSTVQVWQAFSGNHLYTYSRQYRIFAVAWSPGGKRIASGSFDASVQIWDAFSGENIFTYQGHSGPVYTAAWSPDGLYCTLASKLPEAIRLPPGDHATAKILYCRL